MSSGLAAELKVLSPVAIKSLLSKVEGELSNSGIKLVIVWGESGGIKSDIEKGEPFDVAILTPSFVDDLVKSQKANGATRTPIARSGIGIAIRRGATKPDARTVDAFKKALLNAKSIGFVERSASSRYLPGLFERLGLKEALAQKLRPLSGPVHEFVANGEPEIALTQVAAIVTFDGIN
jgi:molybdate transport system substrate-binding protein